MDNPIFSSKTSVFSRSPNLPQAIVGSFQDPGQDAGCLGEGSIESGNILSLTYYFYVPKGDENIQMVYNGTSCGLDNSLFSPHFELSVVQHTLRSLQPGYFRADLDIAEMILSFILGEKVCPSPA